MNCTHIFTLIDPDNVAKVALFDAAGVKVYEGQCTLTLPQYTEAVRNRKLDNRAHEQLVRFITRECLTLDVGMSTPIYAI